MRIDKYMNDLSLTHGKSGVQLTLQSNRVNAPGNIRNMLLHEKPGMKLVYAIWEAGLLRRYV
jgi:hypothetical protein